MILLAVLFLLEERWRGGHGLRVYRSELAARGEKLTVDELSPVITAGPNAFRQFVRVASQVSAARADSLPSPPSMKIIAPGRALSARSMTTWNSSSWWGTNRMENWTMVGEALSEQEKVLAELRDILKEPVLESRINYHDGFNIMLNHLAPAKGTAQWLEASAQWHLHENRPTEALRDMLAATSLAQVFAREPIIISQLVRFALLAIAERSVWEALQMEGWTEGDLQALQKAWDRQELWRGMQDGIEMERAMGLATMKEYRSKKLGDVASALNGWPGAPKLLDPDGSVGIAVSQLPWGDRLLALLNDHVSQAGDYVQVLLWKTAWSDQDARQYLIMQTAFLDASRRGLAETSYQTFLKEQQDAQPDLSNPYDRTRYLFSAAMIPVLDRVLLKAVVAETRCRLLVTAIALERHHLRHGAYPTDLNGLVPAFLESEPRDPMNGEILRYRLLEDGAFLLYSVGENGADDGGDMTPEGGGKLTMHQGRDLVWPRLANQEEAARSDASQKLEQHNKNVGRRVPSEPLQDIQPSP